jgi:RimJ/RimL family protein N-acetyltransferase
MKKDIKSIKLESSMLILRSITTDDCKQDYLNWLQDPKVNCFLETRWQKQTINSIYEFIVNIQKDENNYLFAIVDKSTNKHIGNIKLGPINWQHGIAEISYFIGDVDFWGKGYATQAISTLTEWGFKKLKLHFVKAGFYQSNIASQKALVKSGYEFQAIFKNELIAANGVREDHVWYGKFNQ